MHHLISFRPDVIGNGTAFEAQALIYKYLQDNYGYEFTLIKSSDDLYFDRAFKIISLPAKKWKVKSCQLPFLKYCLPDRQLKALFLQADGILTVDPTIYPQGALAISLANQLKKPVWFDASRTDFSGVTSLGWHFRYGAIQELLHQTTGIIITVPKCIERFQSAGLFDVVIAPKFTVMGHPVDTTLFKPTAKLSEQDGILRILVVSRLVPEKGLFYILEALTPILQERQNVQLLLMGTGSMKPLLEREIEERNLLEKVAFLEPISHQKVSSMLAQSDIFLNHALSLPAWEEFFGIANLEAMACGLPSVVSLSGGIPYAIREDGVAVLIPERDIIEMRKQVVRLLDSTTERIEMGQRARDYVERHYSLPVVAEKYHRMLQQHMPRNL